MIIGGLQFDFFTEADLGGMPPPMPPLGATTAPN